MTRHKLRRLRLAIAEHDREIEHTAITGAVFMLIPIAAIAIAAALTITIAWYAGIAIGAA